MSDEAYNKGLTDYPCSIYANPYKEYTVEFRRWIDGWVDAVINERGAIDVGNTHD